VSASRNIPPVVQERRYSSMSYWEMTSRLHVAVFSGWDVAAAGHA
jgi:hypothetical protein